MRIEKDGDARNGDMKTIIYPLSTII